MTISDTLIGLVTEIEASDDRIKSENTHKSDIYKKAKSDGFNVKALRKVIAARHLDESERDQNDSDFDLYWSAIHGLVSAHVEIIDEIQPETANEAAGTRPVPSVSVETAPGPVQRSNAGNSAEPMGVTGGERAATNIIALTPGGTSIPFNGSIGG